MKSRVIVIALLLLLLMLLLMMMLLLCFVFFLFVFFCLVTGAGDPAVRRSAVAGRLPPTCCGGNGAAKERKEGRRVHIYLFSIFLSVFLIVTNSRRADRPSSPRRLWLGVSPFRFYFSFFCVGFSCSSSSRSSCFSFGAFRSAILSAVGLFYLRKLGLVSPARVLRARVSEEFPPSRPRLMKFTLFLYHHGSLSPKTHRNSPAKKRSAPAESN